MQDITVALKLCLGKTRPHNLLSTYHMPGAIYSFYTIFTVTLQIRIPSSFVIWGDGLRDAKGLFLGALPGGWLRARFQRLCPFCYPRGHQPTTTPGRVRPVPPTQAQTRCLESTWRRERFALTRQRCLVSGTVGGWGCMVLGLWWAVLC